MVLGGQTLSKGYLLSLILKINYFLIAVAFSFARKLSSQSQWELEYFIIFLCIVMLA